MLKIKRMYVIFFLQAEGDLTAQMEEFYMGAIDLPKGLKFRFFKVYAEWVLYDNGLSF